MSIYPANSSYLLSNFLFHLRTPLHSIKGAACLAKQCSEQVPVNVLAWLGKWAPAVDMWISAEADAHSLKDGKAHDWEQIVFEMADNMKDVSNAYDEAKTFEIPESGEGKIVVDLALHGIKFLNETIQPILNKDYSRLL